MNELKVMLAGLVRNFFIESDLKVADIDINIATLLKPITPLMVKFRKR